MLFRCQKCGTCCRSVKIPITYSDIKRWQQEQRWDILAEVRWLIDKKRLYPVWPFFTKTAFNSACPFLSHSNRCKIYETRPRICRDYPQYGGKRMVLTCPAVKAGAKFDQKTVRQIGERQRADLMDTLTFHNEVTAILRVAPPLKYEIEQGLVEFDKSTGTYRFADRITRRPEDSANNKRKKRTRRT